MIFLFITAKIFAVFLEKTNVRRETVLTVSYIKRQERPSGTVFETKKYKVCHSMKVWMNVKFLPHPHVLTCTLSRLCYAFASDCTRKKTLK